MVTCELTGGFGNQLCQVAAVIAYAQKHAMAFCLPDKTADPAIWPETFFPSDPASYHNTLWVESYQQRDWLWHQEPDNQEYKEIPAYPYVQLRGHFQSYKYWKDCLPLIRKSLFGEGPMLMQDGVSAIHVRRGDYLKYPVKHPVVTEKYLIDAIRYSFQQGIKRFVVFSDDMQWCRAVLDGVFRRSMQLLDVEILFQNLSDTRTDFIEMMCCDHHIISNSSYSLMAAHLRQNPSGIIIAPAIWTLEPRQVWNTDDIIPPNWIKI